MEELDILNCPPGVKPCNGRYCSRCSIIKEQKAVALLLKLCRLKKKILGLNPRQKASRSSLKIDVKMRSVVKEIKYLSN